MKFYRDPFQLLSKEIFQSVPETCYCWVRMYQRTRHFSMGKGMYNRESLKHSNIACNLTLLQSHSCPRPETLLHRIQGFFLGFLWSSRFRRRRRSREENVGCRYLLTQNLQDYSRKIDLSVSQQCSWLPTLRIMLIMD